MRIIVDTNILISTMIQPNSRIGSLLMRDLDGKAAVFSCYYLYVEIFDKKERIKKYSKLDEIDLLELLYLVLRKVTFVNEEQISKASWDTAKELTKDIDIKDVSFVALALEMKAKLWTGDKKLYAGLREKGFQDVLNTRDLEELA
jgi:predicted nucleic acid-binding protein